MIKKIFIPLFFQLMVFSVAGQSLNTSPYLYNPGKSLWENYASGFIDTFHIYSAKFRIRMIDSSFHSKLLLEKEDVMWRSIDTLDFSSDGYKRTTLSFDNYGIKENDNFDFNNDGYSDFAVQYRWFKLIYLFNPKKNTLEKCGFFYTETDHLTPIYKGSFLYFDIWYYKFKNWWSYLYMIKHNQRINLGIAILQTSFSATIHDYLPTNIKIEKIAADTIVIAENKNTAYLSDSNIRQYWKNNWKKFYSNSLKQIIPEMPPLYPDQQPIK